MAVGAVGAIALTVLPSQSVAVDDINSEGLREAVTVGGIMGHERVFQRIANRNDGTRASGTSGYDASADYVERTLRQAGYNVFQQEFTFPFFRELAPAVAEQVSPTPADYEVTTMDYSGSGDVTGDLFPIDTEIPPPETAGTASGACDPSDVPAAPSDPAIALIQRGSCTFEIKAANAEAKGYDAVIIFNEGQPGRTDPVAGTLGRPFDLPVVGMSFEDGAALTEQDEATPVVMHVATSTESDLEAKTTNVIAETPGGDPTKTTVVGAHLDSVIEGAGIQDNGTGSATILEIAEEMAELRMPRNRIRFAFWGAEESGLLGSEHYVDNLNDRQLNRIKANLNFDMVGSPNYVRFVYDGDGDGAEGNPVGPPGSAQIENILTEHFDGENLESDPTPFNGRSDYGPFIAVGIPAGGLFTGAEGIKTAEQAAVYGGTAGVAYDSCYHQACDEIRNVNTQALSEMSDAAAHATWTLARTRTGFFEDGSLRTARYRSPKFEYSGSHAQR